MVYVTANRAIDYTEAWTSENWTTRAAKRAFCYWEGIVEKDQRPESWLSALLGLNYHQCMQTDLALFCLYVTSHVMPPDYPTQLSSHMEWVMMMFLQKNKTYFS